MTSLAHARIDSRMIGANLAARFKLEKLAEVRKLWVVSKFLVGAKTITNTHESAG